MKKRKMPCLMSFFLCADLFVSACLPTARAPIPPAAPLRVGLVTSPGPIAEGTFNQLAIAGAQRAVELGGGEFAHLESASPRDIGANIRTFIAQGYGHIVVVGPSAADATAAIANRNQAITFSIVDFSFDPALPNAQGLIFREDQAAYLAGALAGMFSHSRIVGVVAGRDVPRVRKYRNGFGRGVEAVCPECRVMAAYLTSAADAPGGEATAREQIAAGADVIFGVDGETGAAAVVYAARRGVYAIGTETDVYLTTFAGGSAPGADHVLTSAIKRVDVAVQASIDARQRGTFAPGTLVFDASNSGIGLAPFHAAESVITAKITNRVAEILAGLAQGSIDTGIDPDTGEIDPSY